MSLVQCVLLDSSRMPSAAEWSRAIGELGFTTMELDPRFHVKQDGGHRPCLYKGRKTGFEYAWELIEDAEIDDEVRDEVLEHAGKRDAMVSFVTHGSEDAYFAAFVAAAVLAKLTDGVYWHAESNGFFTSEETLALAREREPVVFRWGGGEVSLGYLGRFRWRLKHAGVTVEAADTKAAARLAFDYIFSGATPGRESTERAPIELQLPDGKHTFVADKRMFNGWSYSSAKESSDLGSHDLLLNCWTALLSESAEQAWALGVEPERSPPLGVDFCFQSFESAADPDALCRRLASVLTQRLQASPNPGGAFLSAMEELKALGHDLWRRDLDYRWAYDYATYRPGAGLHIELNSLDTETGTPNEATVEVGWWVWPSEVDVDEV
jgi:hypothetical protein